MHKKETGTNYFSNAESYRLLAQQQYYLSYTQAEIYLIEAQKLFIQGLELEPNNRWGMAHLGTTQRMLAPVQAQNTHQLYQQSVKNLRSAIGLETSELMSALPSQIPKNHKFYPWAWAQLGQTHIWWGLRDLYNATNTKGGPRYYECLQTHFTKADLAFTHAVKENYIFGLGNAMAAILNFFWAMAPDSVSKEEMRDHAKEKLNKAVEHIERANSEIKDWAWGMNWKAAIFNSFATYQRTLGEIEPALEHSLDSHEFLIAGGLISPGQFLMSQLWGLIWPDTNVNPRNLIDIPLSRYLYADQLFFDRKFDEAFAIMDTVWDYLK